MSGSDDCTFLLFLYLKSLLGAQQQNEQNRIPNTIIEESQLPQMPILRVSPACNKSCTTSIVEHVDSMPQHAKCKDFVDETRRVKEKFVKKKDHTCFKKLRLRKSLRNDDLLKNYFVFDTKTEESNNDLTTYKIVHAKNHENVITEEKIKLS